MRQILIMTMLSAIPFFNGVKPEKEIEGVWLTQNEKMKVEFYNLDEVKNAKVVWLAEPTETDGTPRKDENNPDKDLRDRPLMGIDILHDLTYSNGYWEGSIYAPRRGMTMDVKLKKLSDNELEVTISHRGFERKQIWNRY